MNKWVAVQREMMKKIPKIKITKYLEDRQKEEIQI